MQLEGKERGGPSYFCHLVCFFLFSYESRRRGLREGARAQLCFAAARRKIPIREARGGKHGTLGLKGSEIEKKKKEMRGKKNVGKQPATVGALLVPACVFLMMITPFD